MSDYAGTKGEQSGMVQVLSVLSMILLCFVLMLAVSMRTECVALERRIRRGRRPPMPKSCCDTTLLSPFRTTTTQFGERST